MEDVLTTSSMVLVSWREEGETITRARDESFCENGAAAACTGERRSGKKLQLLLLLLPLLREKSSLIARHAR